MQPQWCVGGGIIYGDKRIKHQLEARHLSSLLPKQLWTR
jgi:hypothetical protein